MAAPRYAARLPAGVDVTSSGPLAARVANSGDAPIHVRVSDWGLGACAGWVSFSPERSADVPAHSSVDFSLEDQSSSGIPFRVAVEVWAAPCGGACSGAPSGFWFGPLAQP